MPPEGSVTQLIADLKTGDEAAAQGLWERYFDVLVRFARKKLQGATRGMGDEEDVALSALKSLCLGAQRGKFPQLSDRDSLWRLLVVLTSRKAFDQKAHDDRQKRGGGKPDSPGHRTAPRPASAGPLNIEQILSKAPSPDFIVSMAEEWQRLMDSLDDNKLQTICLWKMEGYTNEEIAEKLGCETRTVERKLALIRKKWTVGDKS